MKLAPAEPLPWGPRTPDGGPSNRAILRMIGMLLIVVVVLWIAWQSRQIIVWIAVSTLLAVAIDPLVRRFQRRLKLPRALAITAVFLLGTLAIGVAASIFVPRVIDASEQLTEDLPGYADELQQSRLVQDLDERYGLLDEIEPRLTEALTDVAGPSTVVDITTRVANGLVALITIGVMTFLLSLYGAGFRGWVIKNSTTELRPRVVRLVDDMYRVIAGYVVGLFTIAAVAGTTAWIFLTAIGIPGASALALWVALMTLVPLVGATIGGVPYVAVAFFTSIPLGIAALVFLLVYQQVENNLVQPLIQKRAVQLNPLWVIIAVLIGATLVGIVGVLVAIPVAGILQVLLQDLWRNRQRAVPTAGPANMELPY